MFRAFVRWIMRDANSKIDRVKITIPPGIVLTPNDIASIITNVGNLAMNRSQIRANDVELTIMGTPETAGSPNQQRDIDAATTSLNQSTTALEAAIKKENQ